MHNGRERLCPTIARFRAAAAPPAAEGSEAAFDHALARERMTRWEVFNAADRYDDEGDNPLVRAMDAYAEAVEARARAALTAPASPAAGTSGTGPREAGTVLDWWEREGEATLFRRVKEYGEQAGYPGGIPKHTAEAACDIMGQLLRARLRARPAAGGTETRFAALRYLLPGWDSYRAAASAPAAIDAAQAWHAAVAVVPTSGGGVQLEWHLGGVDVEVTFDAAGRIVGLLTALAPTERSETDG